MEKSYTKQEFINSYNVGKNSKFLKIFSAHDKGRRGNKRRLVSEALTFPYIQPNSPYNMSWFVFDIDTEFDVNLIFDKNLALPNFIVYTKENGHAQVWYKLKNPIWLQFKDARAYQYQKAVYEALRDKLDADKHFNRAMCKNPFFYSDEDKNTKWSRVDFTRQEYTLQELAEHLDINFNVQKSSKRNVNVNPEVVEEFPGAEKGSRNLSLFEHCRIEIYKYFAKSNCSESELLQWSQKYIEIQNENNNPPLEKKECESMAKSIATWTYNNIKPCNHKTQKYDDVARERSLITRVKAKNKKIVKIKKLLKINPNLSNREISRRLGFSTNSVNAYVKTIHAQEEQLKIAKENQALKKLNTAASAFLNSACERFVNQVVCADYNLNLAGGFVNGPGT